MANIEAYEANLEMRLQELKREDFAYRLHELSIIEAIIFANRLHGVEEGRILDCGCGLGFITQKLSGHWDTTGIDISSKAIDLARKEHLGITFYQASAESFPKMMTDLDLEPFDHVLLNMVLHSVDDEEAVNILRGAKDCLKPEGTVLLVLPTWGWLQQKLIEYAQDKGMQRETGIQWICEQLAHKKIELPIRIRSGEYYPHPLTIYNRTIDDYGRLLTEGGFRVVINSYSANDSRLLGTQSVPYWMVDDHTANIALNERGRMILLSFAM